MKELKSGSQRGIWTPMFTVALFTIAKTWKQAKSPLMAGWIRKCGVHILLSLKKDIWDNMDEPGGYWATWNMPVTEKQTWCDTTCMKNLILLNLYNQEV